MMKTKYLVVLSIVVLFTGSGCATTSMMGDTFSNLVSSEQDKNEKDMKVTATTVGVGAGFALGKILGLDNKRALVIGGLVGGSVGYLVADDVAKRKREAANALNHKDAQIKAIKAASVALNKDIHSARQYRVALISAINRSRNDQKQLEAVKEAGKKDLQELKNKRDAYANKIKEYKEEIRYIQARAEKERASNSKNNYKKVSLNHNKVSIQRLESQHQQMVREINAIGAQIA